MGDQPGWLALVSPTDMLKVSASDVDQLTRGCGTYGALKVRPRAKPSGWARRYDDNQPFLLGLIRDLCLNFHGDPRAKDWDGLNSLLNEALDRCGLHAGLRQYARQAIENYLECHDVIQQEIGPLQFKVRDPQVPVGHNRFLHVWAPVYATPSGIREVRRLRLGSARNLESELDPWTTVAAHIVSLVRPIGDVRRVRVVEIGLGDGSWEVTFDGTPSEANAAYEAVAIPRIQKIVSAHTATPGYSCKDCKIAGLCDSLESLNGFLGQVNPGACTRSVSARDIEVYEVCPAQWHLSNSSFLPRADVSSAASSRGVNVHRTLAQAHSGVGRCTPQSFDDHISHLSDTEILEARPFLANHPENCPVEDGAQIIGSEVSIYGYDAQADLVIASKPDLVYVDAGGTLVIRETKTTTKEIPETEAEAFDKYLAVPWLINLFGSGYKGPFHSEVARLELEVMSPTESRLFSWDLDDRGLLRMARKEVRLRTRDWHSDSVWKARPGNHCDWCPVRKWCPEARAADDSGSEIEPRY